MEDYILKTKQKINEKIEKVMRGEDDHLIEKATSIADKWNNKLLDLAMEESLLDETSITENEIDLIGEFSGFMNEHELEGSGFDIIDYMEERYSKLREKWKELNE